MIKSWNECGIEKFYQIDDAVRDTELSQMEKNIKLISLLLEIPEQDVYAMDMTTFNNNIQKLQWVNKFDFNKKWTPSSIVINGVKYNVVTKTKKLSIGQYIDFQTFWQRKDIRNYIGNLLACFVIPENKKYGEDYDPSELAIIIKDNLDIVTAYSLLFFSLKKFLDLTMSSFFCLKRIAKTKEQKQEITKIIQTLLAGWSLSTESQN